MIRVDHRQGHGWQVKSDGDGPGHLQFTIVAPTMERAIEEVLALISGYHGFDARLRRAWTKLVKK